MFNVLEICIFLENHYPFFYRIKYTILLEKDLFGKDWKIPCALLISLLLIKNDNVLVISIGESMLGSRVR